LSSILYPQADIVGGSNADIEDYPYQAALLYNSGGFSYAFCGASIIHEYWILTAAHCVEGESASNIDVKLGSDNFYAQGGTSYSSSEIIIHNNYNSNTYNNDIALIKLNTPISFNNTKQPVLLMCDEQVDLGVQDTGQISWITGWGETEGTTSSTQLQVVSVPITTESNYGWEQIDSDMIMAGYQDGGYDSCQGDSGGPMVVLGADESTYLQCGIVSWGNGCADPGYPGVYTRVSYFIDWICDNTDGDVCANESDFCASNSIYGCTDNTAQNYDQFAAVDDGSCQYACEQTVFLDIEFDCWPEETGWMIINQNGNIIDSESAGSYTSSSIALDICLPEGCYTFMITDSYGDGLGGSQWSGCSTNGNYEINAGSEILVNGEGDFGYSSSHDFCVIADILGCTDGAILDGNPIACNYNPLASIDDGSCIYPEEAYDCDGNVDMNWMCDSGDLLYCEWGDFQDQVSWSITHCNGDVIIEGGAPFVACVDLPDSYLIYMYDSGVGVENGWNGNFLSYQSMSIGCQASYCVGQYGDCEQICDDISACNYGMYTICEYPATFYDCNGDCLLDTDGDGVCDELEIFGCTNPIADNYNPEATEDDNFCNYPAYNQSINLSIGWGLWSTHIEPEDMNLASVFSEIINSVTIIKDENGSVYWPEYNLNSIGNLQNGAGYQIKMNHDTILNISGSIVSSEYNIALNSGWSILGYVPLICNNTVDMMTSLVNQMVIMKDEDGAVYWPEFGLNSIGNMCPGKGYQIKLNNSTIFNYPANGRFGFSMVNSNQNIYYSNLINTGNNMTIGFPITSWADSPSIGDEIAAFDQHGKVVGSTIFNGKNIALTVWGDDLTTDEKDGLAIGESIMFNIWNSETNTISELIIDQWDSGTHIYAIDGISIASSIVVNNAVDHKQLIKIIDILGRETENRGFNFKSIMVAV